MFRRAFVLNLAFSLVSTAAILSAFPTPAGLAASARDGLKSFAADSAILSPLVTGVLSLR